MKQIKSPLVVAFAIIGVCAVIYFFWHLYQQHVDEERARAMMAAPPQVPGVSQLYKPSKKPPPQ
jgi:hypothetical protein